MLSRDYLLAGIDVSLCLLIVFALGFLAVRYDEVRGEQAVPTSLQVVRVAGEGDFTSLSYLGIIVSADGVWTQEFRDGVWLSRDGDWRSALAETRLPLVIYDLGTDDLLAEVVRAAVTTGQPVAITHEAQGGYRTD